MPPTSYTPVSFRSYTQSFTSVRLTHVAPGTRPTLHPSGTGC